MYKRQPVTFTISGVTDGGEAFAQEFTLYVQISDGVDPSASESESNQTSSSQPRLMVTGYTLDGNCLEAGEKAAVKVSLRNTSSSQIVKNVKLSFSEESGEILAEGTGTAYCAQIGAGGSYTWSFAVTAMTTAQSVSYTHLDVYKRQGYTQCGALP